MIRKAGNQAFRALAGILDLPGSEHASDVDIGVVSSVLDLQPIVQAGVVERWELIFNLAAGTGGDKDATLLPSGSAVSLVAAMRNGVRQVTADLPELAAQLDRQDLWITAAGFFDDAADLTAGYLYWQYDSNAKLILYRADAALIEGMPFSGTPFLVPYPWFRPAQTSSTSQPRLRARFTLTAGGSTNTTAYLRLFAAKPGVLPYR